MAFHFRRSARPDALQEQLFAPGSQGQLLWNLNLITRSLADSSSGSRTQSLLAPIEIPEVVEAT